MTSKVAFKNLLISTLVKNELDKKRAAKMEILDFLTVLNTLNAIGIHFN